MAEISTFDFARLAALKQYSDLEGELCLVMRYALGTDYQAAATVFYQIANTRARYAIIGKLLGLREEGAFQKVWDRIERWLGPCDTARNQLVHWNEGETILLNLASQDPIEVHSVERHKMLKHPAGGSPKSPKHYEQDIRIKRDEMRVMLHIVNRFANQLLGPQDWPWSDIFREPPVCRNPVKVLRCLNYKGHAAPLSPYDRKQLPLFPTKRKGCCRRRGFISTGLSLIESHLAPVSSVR